MENAASLNIDLQTLALTAAERATLINDFHNGINKGVSERTQRRRHTGLVITGIIAAALGVAFGLALVQYVARSYDQDSVNSINTELTFLIILAIFGSLLLIIIAITINVIQSGYGYLIGPLSCLIVCGWIGMTIQGAISAGSHEQRQLLD